MPTPAFDIPNPFDPPRIPDRFLDPPLRWEIPVWPDLRWGPAQIKVLVVCDGNSYSTDPNVGFSLGLALQDAFDPAHDEHPSYARFTFTKAHRSTTAGVTPGFEDFRFNAGSLNTFDEVWLFGFTPGAPYLSATEVNTIEAFMDGGGGVLAMGDHEDLGLGLCGGIQRVRSMRKWWFSSPPPPAGMIQAPDSTNLTRNDTQQLPSNSESDAVPQPIYPNYRYFTPFWRPWWMRQKYPHPILCGPRGAITVMPDHPHEGDCILPAAAFAAEFTGGVPVEVIARGRNVIGRNKAGFVITDDREFGLLGVWNGHLPAANQGRVVVDATWHHWFNINLRGLRVAGGNNYRDILAFFRNVAIWLAPKDQQAAMRRAGQRILLLTPTLVETLPSLREFHPERFYHLGVAARDALGRIAPQCQSAAWFFEIVSPFLPAAAMTLALNDRFEGVHNLVEAAALDALATTVFGGVVNAVGLQMNKHGLDKMESWDKELDRASAEGAKMGLEVAVKELTRSQRTVKSLLT
ncbi:MAG TPA: hypothetical protein VFY22_14765 [Hydrogenophaga sp.]|nr:hypothetical protein [Hydrogenophaga sp.]